MSRYFYLCPFWHWQLRLFGISLNVLKMRKKNRENPLFSLSNFCPLMAERDLFFFRRAIYFYHSFLVFRAQLIKTNDQRYSCIFMKKKKTFNINWISHSMIVHSFSSRCHHFYHFHPEAWASILFFFFISTFQHFNGTERKNWFVSIIMIIIASLSWCNYMLLLLLTIKIWLVGHVRVCAVHTGPNYQWHHTLAKW